MQPVRNRPLLTDLYAGWETFDLPSKATYLYGTTFEERSQHPDEWERRQSDVQFVPIAADAVDRLKITALGRAIRLRSETDLSTLVGELSGDVVYMDVTGLAHHVWAPLLKSLAAAKKWLRVVYVEPADYRPSSMPTEGEIFDLSERIRGIAPLPGFTTLADPPSEDAVCFVPLLGFEGTRFLFALEHVQPPGDKTVPVIGVPGFRPEYPFHTYLGNRSALVKTRAWRSVRFAIANCPFSALHLLEDIASDYPNHLLKVAPIGTKPHSLAAILFALSSPTAVEIIYDHPIPKPLRTAGSANILVYEIGALNLQKN